MRHKTTDILLFLIFVTARLISLIVYAFKMAMLSLLFRRNALGPPVFSLRVLFFSVRHQYRRTGPSSSTSCPSHPAQCSDSSFIDPVIELLSHTGGIAVPPTARVTRGSIRLDFFEWKFIYNRNSAKLYSSAGKISWCF